MPALEPPPRLEVAVELRDFGGGEEPVVHNELAEGAGPCERAAVVARADVEHLVGEVAGCVRVTGLREHLRDAILPGGDLQRPHTADDGAVGGEDDPARVRERLDHVAGVVGAAGFLRANRQHCRLGDDRPAGVVHVGARLREDDDSAAGVLRDEGNSDLVAPPVRQRCNLEAVVGAVERDARTAVERSQRIGGLLRRGRLCGVVRARRLVRPRADVTAIERDTEIGT